MGKIIVLLIKNYIYLDNYQILIILRYLLCQIYLNSVKEQSNK